MDNNRFPKQVLKYKPRGRRDCGRPRKRWQPVDDGTSIKRPNSWRRKKKILLSVFYCRTFHKPALGVVPFISIRAAQISVMFNSITNSREKRKQQAKLSHFLCLLYKNIQNRLLSFQNFLTVGWELTESLFVAVTRKQVRRMTRGSFADKCNIYSGLETDVLLFPSH